MPTSPRPGRVRYPSDLTDEQGSLREPLLPAPSIAGRPEKHPRREIVNAVFFLLHTGCSWRQLPHDLPPWQTVYWCFKRWRDDGTVDRLHDALRDRLRDRDRRDPDDLGRDHRRPVGQGRRHRRHRDPRLRRRQADQRPQAPHRHRHPELLLAVTVTAASVQDRDGGARLLERLRFAMPSIVSVFADGYAGRLVVYARGVLRVAVEVVRKPADQQGFAVPPRR